MRYAEVRDIEAQFTGLILYSPRSIFQQKAIGPVNCGLRNEEEYYLHSRSDSIVSSALAEEDLALFVVRLVEGP